MPDFQPSPQQSDVYRWAAQAQTGDSALIEAVAGSGKTTTLVSMLAGLTGSVVLCAFNKKIAAEIQDRLVKIGVGRNVRAATFHSLGYGAWMKAVGTKVSVDDKKLYNLAEPMMPEQFHKFAVDAASLAKQTAIGVMSPFEDLRVWYYLVEHFELEESLTDDRNNPVATDELIEEGIQWAIKLLKVSVDDNRNRVDFDDMIYAPLIHDVHMWQNDWVLIDEAQDTNNARRGLAKKMLRPGGHLVAVGDRHQAIYGFTGADHDSLDIIASEFNCKHLPLTVSYRCPIEVVRLAQQWVPEIQFAPDAEAGSVTTIQEADFLKLSGEDMGYGNAVLCRNTKPLVALAFNLIRRSIPCHVEGRDIGAGLLALTNKWKTDNLQALQIKLVEYLHKQTELYLSKGQEHKAAALSDKVETVFVICEALPADATVQDLRDKVNSLFQDTPPGVVPRRITLSTIHKAKGREWDRVYWFARNLYQPSHYARQDWQMEQEHNLMYVAATRAKCDLVDVVGAK